MGSRIFPGRSFSFAVSLVLTILPFLPPAGAQAAPPWAEAGTPAGIVPLLLDGSRLESLSEADPAAGINLIEPPEASNLGDANLGYPIEVPPGRLGVQPQLEVTYSSAAGNGWLGLGWNLTVPTITVDTRWGVPRYSATHETETYLLDGRQLTPLAHRLDPVARSAGDTVFHARVEGAFDRIVRHGAGPRDYWWEVTDTGGTVYSYGGRLAAGGREAEAVLTDDPAGNAGSVFVWALREIRDTHGNTVLFAYERVQEHGAGAGDGDRPRAVPPVDPLHRPRGRARPLLGDVPARRPRGRAARRRRHRRPRRLQAGDRPAAAARRRRLRRPGGAQLRLRLRPGRLLEDAAAVHHPARRRRRGVHHPRLRVLRRGDRPERRLRGLRREADVGHGQRRPRREPAHPVLLRRAQQRGLRRRGRLGLRRLQPLGPGQARLGRLQRRRPLVRHGGVAGAGRRRRRQPPGQALQGRGHALLPAQPRAARHRPGRRRLRAPHRHPHPREHLRRVHQQLLLRAGGALRPPGAGKQRLDLGRSVGLPRRRQRGRAHRPGRRRRRPRAVQPPARGRPAVFRHRQQHHARPRGPRRRGHRRHPPRLPRLPHRHDPVRRRLRLPAAGGRLRPARRTS